MPPPWRLEFIIIFTIRLYATLVVVSRSIFPTYASSAFIAQWKSSSSGSFASSVYSERSISSDLDSAYEWLAESRALNDPSSRGKIRWFCPDFISTSNDEIDTTELMKMPLYPLGAVHVPHSGENHTIINICPKNVKMSVVCVFVTSSNILRFTFCLLQSQPVHSPKWNRIS